MHPHGSWLGTPLASPVCGRTSGPSTAQRSRGSTQRTPQALPCTPAGPAPRLRKLERLGQLAAAYQLDEPLLLQVEEQLLLLLQDLRVQVVHALDGLQVMAGRGRNTGRRGGPRRVSGRAQRALLCPARGQGGKAELPRAAAALTSCQPEAWQAAHVPTWRAGMRHSCATMQSRAPPTCSTAPLCTALRISIRSVICSLKTE